MRFVSFLSPEVDNLPKAKGVDIFLTSTFRRIPDDPKFDYDKYEEKFRKTFKVLNDSWGKSALRYRNQPVTGKFSISFFEAVALGIAQNLETLPYITTIKQKIDRLCQDYYFKAASGSGKNAQRRIPELMQFGKTYFSPL